MTPLKQTLLWIVYRQWPTGKVEEESAWFSETLARQRVSELVGGDGSLIGLRSILVNDTPSLYDDGRPSVAFAGRPPHLEPSNLPRG